MKRIMIVMLLLMGAVKVWGEDITFGNGILRVVAVADNAFRISYMEHRKYDLQEWVHLNEANLRMKKKLIGPAVILSTSSGVSVEVDTHSMVVSVKDKTGNVVFRATEHTLKESKVQDLECYEATMRCSSSSDEHLYGLGQFQDGHTDVRGLSRRLTQVNTQISIPMVLSSKGYGLLWNNYGMTEFNPPKESVKLNRESAEGASERVNVTTTSGNREEVRMSNRFGADIEVESDGMYSLLLDVGQSMARRHNIVIDGKTEVDVRNIWLPPTVSTKLYLKKGKHHVSAELRSHLFRCAGRKDQSQRHRDLARDQAVRPGAPRQGLPVAGQEQ